MVMVKGSLLLLVFLPKKVVIWVNGSGFPRRHVHMFFHIAFRIQGIQRRGDGKRLRSPLPLKERGGVRWVCLAIFFLALRLGEVCTGDAWNLPSEGTGVGAFSGWSVQPKGLAHWCWSILCARTS